MRVASGKWRATIGPELERMVQRVYDGALTRVSDAMEEHGETLVQQARAVWPTWTGTSRDGIVATVTLGSEKVTLRIANDATKAQQTARLRGDAPPQGKSASHFATWQAAQGRRSAQDELYGYMIGGKPSTWKRLVMDPERAARNDLVERIGNDVRRLAERE